MENSPPFSFPQNFTAKHTSTVSLFAMRREEMRGRALILKFAIGLAKRN